MINAIYARDGMKYARTHVKRFWDFAYRRAMGISLLTFAMLLAVGFIFSSSLGSVLGSSYAVYLSFWIVLAAVMIFVVGIEFANAHIISVKYMSKKEHKQHSLHMGAWVLVLVLGSLAFALPVMLLTGLPVSFLMVSLGGIMLVTYLSTALLFRVYYHEVAYGAAVLFVFFAAMFFNPGNLIEPSFVSPSTALALPVIAIVVVTGFVGLMLVVDSSRKFIKDFEGGI